MKKIFLVIASTILLTGLLYSDEFYNTPIGKEIVNLGLRFLDNPGDFLFNLHTDNVDFTPVIKERHGTIRTNFYPTIFPATWANINVKVKTISDGTFAKWVPQVDISAQYGRMLAVDVASEMMSKESTETVKPSFQDYCIGIIFTKSVEENTRLYAGFNYSNAFINVKFEKAIEFGAFKMSELDIAVADYFIVTGIENQLRKDKYVVAHLGYGIKQGKIVSRIAWYHKHLELGFNIYPEGLFVVHPFMAWHWYF